MLGRLEAYMFGSKRRAEKKAAEEAATEARTQAELRDAVVKLIALAEGQDEPDPDWPLVLRHGERLFSEIRGAGLFEPRREAGHWEGRSAGVSVPVGDTRLRVRVGKSAGTYVQGVEKPTVIDTGNASISSQRVVFQGDKYTREWDYSKLIGVVHYSDHPATAIQVSNREKTSGIVYAGVASTEPLRLAMTVAIALYNGERDQTLEELRTELAKLDAGPQAVPAAAAAGAAPARPPSVQPSDAGPLSSGTHQGASAASPNSTGAAAESSPATPPPVWAADPYRRHQYRYWDGTRWTDYVADNGQESRDPPPAASA
jgi:Protein of unknown function (DUF2510)